MEPSVEGGYTKEIERNDQTFQNHMAREKKNMTRKKNEYKIQEEKKNINKYRIFCFIEE